MLHSGPGSGAAGAVADEWSGMSNALADIQQEINTGVTGSGATWVGAAGDTARDALGPLGEWAQQASTAADVMRISTELQGDLLGKARADMPAPVPVPQPSSQIGQLVTSQVDFEVAEMSSQLAEQQAYQVMAQYEAATNDNTSTLGDFGEPPTLVVDTTPITGPSVRTRVRTTDPTRTTSRPRNGSTRTPDESTPKGANSTEDSPAKTPTGTGPESTPHEANSSPTPSPTDESTPGTVESTPEPTGIGLTAGAAIDETPATTPSATTPSATTQPTPSTPATTTPPSDAPTTPSSAPASTTNRKSNADNESTLTRPTTSNRFNGAVVPAARRSDDDEDADDVHESKYLIEADDIYGHQTYTPPVIGESPRRR